MKNLAFVILIFVSLSSFGNDSNYVFGWTQLNDPDLKKPRGGTTVGEKVTLDNDPNDLWVKLQNPELTKFEKVPFQVRSQGAEARCYSRNIKPN